MLILATPSDSSQHSPHSGGGDDPNEEDAAPAEGMTRLEYKDVFQEEGVQLRKLQGQRVH